MYLDTGGETADGTHEGLLTVGEDDQSDETDEESGEEGGGHVEALKLRAALREGEHGSGDGDKTGHRELQGHGALLLAVALVCPLPRPNSIPRV